jgi:hypothetical protein
MSRLLMMLLTFGCGAPAEPLPTQQAIVLAEIAAPELPALYTQLYDAPLPGGASPALQRVRILAWLQAMKMTAGQLATLDELAEATRARQATLAAAEREIIDSWTSRTAKTLDAIWTSLQADDDPLALDDLAHALAQAGGAGQPSTELATLRLEALRSLMDAQVPFLRALGPEQEQQLALATFFLRDRLDPVGTPGVFAQVVGSTYNPGEYDVLTRGSRSSTLGHMNIAGLWSDNPALEPNILHDAQREVILLMALLDPELPTAIVGAQAYLASNQP